MHLYDSGLVNQRDNTVFGEGITTRIVTTEHPFQLQHDLSVLFLHPGTTFDGNYLLPEPDFESAIGAGTVQTRTL